MQTNITSEDDADATVETPTLQQRKAAKSAALVHTKHKYEHKHVF